MRHLDGLDEPLDLPSDPNWRQTIDLRRTSVPDLARQFVHAIERVSGRAPLERRAEWLVVAARLLLLRSKLLLPTNPQVAARAEREIAIELRLFDDRLAARAATGWLVARPQLGLDVFTRPRGPNPQVANYMDLMYGCLTLLRGKPGPATVGRAAPPPLWRLADALARMRAQLAPAPPGAELATFVPPIPAGPRRTLRIRAAVAATLLAGLELARVAEIDLDQAECWGPVLVSSADMSGRELHAAFKARSAAWSGSI